MNGSYGNFWKVIWNIITTYARIDPLTTIVPYHGRSNQPIATKSLSCPWSVASIIVTSVRPLEGHKGHLQALVRRSRLAPPFSAREKSHDLSLMFSGQGWKLSGVRHLLPQSSPSDFLRMAFLPPTAVVITAK